MRRIPWQISYAKELDMVSGIRFHRHVFALRLCSRIYTASFAIVKIDESTILDEGGQE